MKIVRLMFEKLQPQGYWFRLYHPGWVRTYMGGQINQIQNAIEASLPLLRRGRLKRIGMITDQDSSISNCGEDCNYGQHMAWAGLNKQVCHAGCHAAGNCMVTGVEKIGT